MKHILTLTLFIFMFTLLRAQEQQEQFHKELETVFNDYHEFILEQFPESATYNGDHRYDDKLTNYSIGARNERTQRIKMFSERVKQFPSESMKAQDIVNRDLFLYQIDNWIDGEKYKSWMMPLNQQGGIHIEFPLIIESQKIDSSSDVEKYVSRLKGFD